MSNSASALYDKTEQLLREVEPAMIDWRHHLHANPELSNREEQTAAFIVEKLRGFGIPPEDIHEGVGGFGVVANIHGAAENTTERRRMLLRADIDALPVKEDSGEPFASTVVDEDYPGGAVPVAHACGHDTHTAMLLAAAKVLFELREDLPGDVQLVFQPAEEGAPPGETGGARVMVEDMRDKGLLDTEPTMAFGMHIGPLPSGWVGYARGIQYAASETVKVTITGEQVHGSMPWAGVDPLPAAGEILSNAAQIYRQIDANERFTISFGHVVDQGRFNIIGNQVELWGTVRSLKDAVMEDVNARLRRFATSIAEAHGCTATVEFTDGVPALNNGAAWVDSTLPTLERVAGGKPVVEIPPTMGYDDMSEFVNAFGGLYLALGGQDFEFGEDLKPKPGSGRGMVPNHSPRFYALDESLLAGARLHANVTLDHLFGEISGEDASA